MHQPGFSWVSPTDGLTRNAGSEDGSRSDSELQVRLRINDLRIRGPHGVYEEEREAGNEFSVDVELEGDFSSAIDSDRIEASVDVDQVATTVRDINRHNQFHLIESFADAIARGLLAQFPIVSQVTVRVTKLTLVRLESVKSSTAEVIRRRS